MRLVTVLFAFCAALLIESSAGREVSAQEKLAVRQCSAVVLEGNAQCPAGCVRYVGADPRRNGAFGNICARGIAVQGRDGLTRTCAEGQPLVCLPISGDGPGSCSAGSCGPDRRLGGPLINERPVDLSRDRVVSQSTTTGGG